MVSSFPPFLFAKKRAVTGCWKESFGRGNEWTRIEERQEDGSRRGKGEEESRYLTQARVGGGWTRGKRIGQRSTDWL
jgi:hypothetical protein